MATSSQTSQSLGISHDTVPYSRPPTPSSRTQIGFVGLGSMGYVMARNLATHRASSPNPPLPLVVWNRSAHKAEKLVQALGEEKVRIAADLTELVLDCDVIITNLANDAVVKEVYDTIISILKANPPNTNKILVETSTVYPSLSGNLDAAISSLTNCHFVTSPVFGNPVVADKAQLVICMGGDYRSKKETAYLFVPAIGRKVIDLGENVEKAATFKIIGNSMILGNLEIMAESYTLAEKTGIGAASLHTLIKDIFPAPILVAYSHKIAHEHFDAKEGFAIDGGIKDATHARNLAQEFSSPMPALNVAHQNLITARAIHEKMKKEGTTSFDVLDWSGILASTRVAAGLDALDIKADTSVVRED